jgi:hypothetical protein
MALRDRQTGRQGSLGWKAAFLAGVRGQSDRQFGVVRDPAQRQTLVERRFERTPLGVKNIWRAILPNGRATESVTEVVFPTLRVVGGLPRASENIATDPEGFKPVESIGWVLPIDNTHYRIYVAGRVTRRGQLGELRSKFNGKYWRDMTEEEHQKFPGDYETQGQPGSDHVSFRRASGAGRSGYRNDPTLFARGAEATSRRTQSGRCQLRQRRAAPLPRRWSQLGANSTDASSFLKRKVRPLH